MDNTPTGPLPSLTVARMPLVWTAIFASLGIAVDCWLSLPVSWLVAMTLITVATGLYFSSRQSSLSPLCILLGVSSLFAAWHHHQRNFYAANEIAFVASRLASPVMLRGTVLGHVSHVESRPSSLSTIPGGPEVRFTLSSQLDSK